MMGTLEQKVESPQEFQDDPIAQVDVHGNLYERDFLRKFIGPLIKDPEIKENPELIQDLITIAKSAYSTTFTDESDYIKGCMNLYLLEEHRKKGTPRIDKCINYLMNPPVRNWIINAHIEDFQNGHYYRPYEEFKNNP